MPGIGFVIFVLPVLIGLVLSALLCLSEKYRYLVVYLICMPFLGSVLGWYGLGLGTSYAHDYIYGVSHSWFASNAMFLGLVGGYIVGLGAGGLAGLALNRIWRLLSS